jgi:DNA (cytosine-5)-methyltransferase 1
MFPKNFTKEMDNQEVISDNRRAFLMGNALVVGVVQKFGEALLEQLYMLKEKEKE